MPKSRTPRQSSSPIRPPEERGEHTLYTPAEAANYIGVKEKRIRRAVAEREIPYVKVGKLLRFRKHDLDAYIEANLVPAGDGR